MKTTTNNPMTAWSTRLASLSFVLLLSLVLSFTGFAQTATVVTPTGGTALGNTNGSGADPVCRYYNNIHYQVIYTAAELTAAGIPANAIISKLAWNVTESSVSLGNYTIKMANTTAANGNANDATATTTVKNAFTYSVALGYNDITFDNNFIWNGTSNLLIDVCTGIANPYTSPYGGVAARTGYLTTAYGSRCNRVDGGTGNCSVASPLTNKPVVRLTWTGNTACSGTPATASVSTSAGSICAGVNATLTATGATSANGISNQWQVSTNGGSSWSAISGATSTSTSVSPTVNSLYRFVSTCANSGLSSTSSTVAVNPNTNIDACYCSNTGGGASYYINNVATTGGLTNISQTSGQTAGGYADYTGTQNLTLNPGSVINFSVGVTGGTFGIGIWVDYNRNGSFADAGEQVYNSAAYVAGATGSFTVPAGASIGNTRMRVVANYLATSPTACTGSAYTEAEDYRVIVQAPAPMTLNSISVAQQTGIIGAGTTGAVLRINVNTAGLLSALSVSSFHLSTTGTTNDGEIVSAKMYATGASSAYATTTTFGTYSAPTGIYDINGTATLLSGNNYYWLAYEAAPWITACSDVFDATCDYVTVNGVSTAVTNGNPTGATPVSPPIVVANLSPANGYSASCRNVLLSWTAVAPNTSYDVYVDGSLFAVNVTTGSKNVALAGTHTWDVVPAGTAPTGCFTRSYTAATTLCYCVPSVSYGCGDNDIIARVSVNTLNNNSGTGCPSDPVPGNQGAGVNGNGYSDYTTNPALTTSLMQGYTYPVTVYVGQWSEAFAVWVDGNDDGEFSTAERVGYTTTNPAGSGVAGVLGGSATFPIVLDCNSPVGTHRMRVRCVYGTTGSAITPCAAATYGETEDYNITYTLGPVTEPVAAVVTGPTDAVCNTNLTYTASDYVGALQWQYSTDFTTWFDITGATGATQGLVPNGPAFFALRVRSRGIGCTADVFSEMTFLNVVSPTVSIAQSAATICRGTSATLTASSDYPNAVYTWSNGQTGASITVSPLVETTYSVSVGAALCSGTSSATVSVSGPTATMAQVPSTTGCPGTQHTLTGTLIEGLPASGGMTATSVAYSTASATGTVNAGPSGDDVVSASIALPFSFPYYGTSYNNIVISTNGFISFDGAPGAGCCSGQVIPSATTPNNVVALAWYDLNAAAGTITYYQSGSSFVVDFNGVGTFSVGGNVTGQIVLNADGTIQINSTNISTSGTTTQGVEDINGTSATATAGANGALGLSRVNQSVLFTPPSTVPFTFDGPVTYSWNTGSTDNSISVAPDVTTTYTLTVADNSCASVLPVTVNVYTAPTVSVSNNGPICNGATVSLTPTVTASAPPVIAGGMSATTVAYSTAAATGTVNAGPSGDDVVSGAIALPFAFNYYGTSYSNIYISTNGFVTFNGASGSGCCSGQAIPNTFSPVIALAWYDLNAAAGTITYYQSGSSFVVDFNGVGTFTAGGNVTGQIVLNADGSIQINSTSISTSGTTTQGINAGDGLAGVATASASFGLSSSSQSTLFANVGGQLVNYAWNGGNAATAEVNTATPSANTTYSVTVTDSHGCTASGSTDVEVVYPTVAACASDVTVTADAGQCGAAVAEVGTSNVAVAGAQPCSTTVTSDRPTQFPVGSTTVNWTVTDAYGNTATCSSNVTVTDNENPAISCPAAITQTADAGDCGAIVSIGAATATDNCSVASITSDAPAHFIVGTTTVTWTATDIHGNSSSCTQDITVTDNENPAISCPAAITQTADAGDCGAIVSIGAATATDNCSVASITSDAPAHFIVGTTTVTWTATDIHGNSSSCTQDITVTDNEAPAISCPAAVVVGSDAGVCGARVDIGDASATDNCEVASITNDHASLDYPVGTTTVTWTATDIHGNSSTCTQAVTVNDVEAPVISGVASASIIDCPASPVFSTPTSSDNCSSSMSYADVTTAACGHTYATTRTWTAVDPAGNTTTASQTITVRDITAPSIATNANVYLCYEEANPTLAAPASSDACNSVVVTRTGTNSYPVGLTTVTWTSTDACGNASSSTQNVRRNSQINATFGVTALPGYCQGNVIITILTATGGTGNLSYLWSNGATTNTVTVPNNATYTCTVTDQFSSTGSASNCSRTFSVTANLSTTGILSSYTIIGTYDVHIHGYQTILNGGVGATAATAPAGSGSGCAGGRIKFHQHSTATAGTTFLKAKCIEVDATSAATNRYVGAAAAPPMPVFDAGVAVPNSAAAVTVAANTVVTLSGTVYGNITVKAGGKLTFLHATVDCKNLQIMAGATVRGDKACTRIRMEGKLQVMTGAILNPAVDNHDFAIYVDNTNTSGSGHGAGSGGSGSDANGSVNIMNSAQVKAFIYAPNGALEVHGPGGNGSTGSGSGSGVHATAPATSMTGLFIAYSVSSHGRATWNWNTACATCNYTLRDGETTANASETLKNEDLNAGMVVENFPDPFTDKTNIRFVMANDTHAQVDVFDLNGKFIKSIFNGDVKANQEYRFELDGTDLSNGMYIYKVVTPSNVHTGKMLLIKQ